MESEEINGETRLIEKSDILTVNFVKNGQDGHDGEDGHDGRDGDSIYEVSAYKAFTSTPASNDKPTVTTNIIASTTDFGNN
jgi:hypothetical protein